MSEFLSNKSSRIILIVVAAAAAIALVVGLGMGGVLSPDDEVDTGDQASVEETRAPRPGAPGRPPRPGAPSGVAEGGKEQPSGGDAAKSDSSSPRSTGEELRPLSEPPEESVWALSPDAYDAGVSITMEFEPYGFGPDAYGESVVVNVISAEPSDPDARIPELVGRNVILVFGEAEVYDGGRYSGVVLTRLKGGKIVFELDSARFIGE